jgi:hypothetical protein
MALRAALPLGVRLWAGHGLWSVVAFAFPSVARSCVPFAWYFGVQSLAWSLLGLRVIADAGGMRGSERERIRASMFAGPAAPDLSVRDTAKAPPAYSAAHARHQSSDPRRLPE